MSIIVDDADDQRVGGSSCIILSPRDVILHCAELLSVTTSTKSRRLISVRGTVVYVEPSSKRVDIVYHGAKLIVRMTMMTMTTMTMLPRMVQLPSSSSSSPSPIPKNKNNHVPNDNNINNNNNNILPLSGHRIITDVVHNSLNNNNTNHNSSSSSSSSLSNNNNNADNDDDDDDDDTLLVSSSSSSQSQSVSSSPLLNCMPKLHSEIIVTGNLKKEQRRIFLMATTYSEVTTPTPTTAVTTT